MGSTPAFQYSETLGFLGLIAVSFRNGEVMLFSRVGRRLLSAGVAAGALAVGTSALNARRRSAAFFVRHLRGETGHEGGRPT